MAEKEERQKRLLIKEYDLVCDLSDCKCCEDKDWCSEKDGMTRQEAIELIEKVLEEGWWSGKTFRQLSEAALNALCGAGEK